MAATDTDAGRVRELLDRLTRMHSSESRSDELNPTQVAALGYLRRANRFSRAPSQVAEFLSATRGTVSQTLKALLRKGLIEESRSSQDRRSISYRAMPDPASQEDAADGDDSALAHVPTQVLRDAEAALGALLAAMLAARGGRTFGLCQTCRHHRRETRTARCTLLDVEIDPNEYDAICYEHEPA